MFKLLIIVMSMLSTVVYTPETVPVSPGTYPVQVGYEGEAGEIEKVVNVTVGSNNYVTDGSVAIDANDITATYDQKLTKDFLIQNANAKAWNTETNENYKITDVKVNELDETVTFETILDVKTTVRLNVISREELYEMHIAANEGEFIEMQVFNNFIEYIFFFTIILGLIFTIITFIYMQINASRRFKEIAFFYEQ